MSREAFALHLVGDSESARTAAVGTAGNTLRLSAGLRQSANFATALTAPTDQPEVLVLLEPTAAVFQAAIAAVDRRGLPRWAVVPATVEEVAQFASSEAWTPAVLERSIGFAIALWTLRRDNARLTGDVYTIARRLTHDLRTPLNSISTANEARALLASAAEPAPTLHRAIAVAIEETGGLIERVAPVLAAAVRPKAKQPVDMEEIVWSAREKLDAALRAAGATIVSPPKWPVVNGVPSWLELVWTNLLDNSLKHGGIAPRIELGWKRESGQAIFWVRDTGAGVPAAKRPLLFYPFDRLGELSAPRGYGLSLVHRLIELQGGTTSYVHDATVGGTFYFTLPDET